MDGVLHIMVENETEVHAYNELSTKAAPEKRPEQSDEIVKQSVSMKQKKRKTILLWVISIVILAGIIVTGIFSIEKRSFSDDTKKIAEAAQSVVMLHCYDNEDNLVATASGVVLFDSQTVVTNYHVIDGVYRISSETENDLWFSLDEVVNYDVKKDIAILHTSAATGLTPLKTGDYLSLEKGEKIIAIGSPLGIKNTISDGIVSGIAKLDGIDIIQTTASVSAGSSGGALFNNAGEVVGITAATIIEGQNLNFAVPINTVIEVNETSSGVVLLSSLNTPQEQEDLYLEVTVEELYNNPSEYDGKLVTVTAWNGYYYSSTDYTTDLEFFNIYLIKDKERIVERNKFKNDGSAYDRIMRHAFNYHKEYLKPFNTPYVAAIIREEYFSEPINKWGNKVTVYGKFVYNQYGLEVSGGNIRQKPLRIEVYEYKLYF